MEWSRLCTSHPHSKMKWNLKVTQVQTGYYTIDNATFVEAEEAARAALAKDIQANTVGSSTVMVRELDTVDVSFVEHKAVMEVER